MKKIALLSLAAGAMFFASCTKDYTCTCTDVTTATVLGSTVTTTTTDTYQVKEATSDQAAAACNEATIVTTGTDWTSERTCSLSK